MTRVENWEKQVKKFDDSRFVYLWENRKSAERLLLQKSPEDGEKYALFSFKFHEEISFLDGTKVGSADTQREGKQVATEYMKKHVW